MDAQLILLINQEVAAVLVSNRMLEAQIINGILCFPDERSEGRKLCAGGRGERGQAPGF